MIVWLASYPRSGNTFFRVILNSIFDIKTYSIYDDRGDIGADEKTSEIVGHEFLPEDFDLEKAREEEKTYYIKTHELADSRVYENDQIIYLLRDGRESTLSFTKHRNTFSNQNIQLIDTIYGDTSMGSWGEHVASWNPKNRDNTLLIKFEDLVQDPASFIEQISNFLDIQPIGKEIPTFEELKKINPSFFVSGKTNSWEKIYTEEEHMAFWMKNYILMTEYEYNYKVPKPFENSPDIALIREISNQNTYMMKLFQKQAKNAEVLKSQLNQKEEHIQKQANNAETLKSQLSQKEEHIQKQAENAEALKRELNQKEEHIQKQAKNAETLKSQLSQKEEYIQQQAENAEALKRELSQKEEYIQQQGKNAETLKSQLSQKEEHIQKQAENAEALKRELKERDGQLKAANVTISEKEQHIQKQAKNGDTLRAQLSQLEHELVTSKQFVDEKEQHIQSVSNELTLLEEKQRRLLQQIEKISVLDGIRHPIKKREEEKNLKNLCVEFSLNLERDET